MLDEASPKPKSKSANLLIVVSLMEAVCLLSSVLFNASSRAEMLGVEFPRARDGVGGGSRVSADKVGLCFVDGFLAALFFSAFFASMTFLKSFKENSKDMFGFTQRDLDCASVYASLGPRSWLMYIP